MRQQLTSESLYRQWAYSIWFFTFVILIVTGLYSNTLKGTIDFIELASLSNLSDLFDSSSFFIESGSFYWTEPTWLKFSEMSRFSDQNNERWERILSVSSGKFWNQNWSPRVVHLCWENLKINSRSWTRVSKLRETDHKNIERVPPYFLILLKAYLVL